jgi:hypothetical protein
MAKQKKRIRTIRVSVADVVEGGSKSEFFTALRSALKDCVMLANRVVTSVLKSDDLTQRKADYAALSNNAYAMFKGDGDSNLKGFKSVCAGIARNVVKRYLEKRWQIARGLATAETYRSHPLPLKVQDGFKVWVEAGQWFAKIKIKSKHFVVRLKSDSRFAHQFEGITEAKSICDSTIRVSKNGKVAVLGVACDVHKRSIPELRGTCLLSTTTDSFCVLTHGKNPQPYLVVNPYGLKERIVWHSNRLRRLQIDKKSGLDKRNLNEQIRSVCSKQNGYLRDLSHKLAKQLVREATRLRLKTIQLDFTCQSYLPHFPYHQLKSCLQQKAELVGIAVEDLSDVVRRPKASTMNQPHVYFKLGVDSKRVKIGFSGLVDGSRHKKRTDTSERCVVLALLHPPKDVDVATWLRETEHQYKSLFHLHNETLDGQREWFKGDPIVTYLREAKLLGNAGNLSQIRQYVEVPRKYLSDPQFTAMRDADRESGKVKPLSGARRKRRSTSD